ncbi:MAG: hypothetical protein COA78_37205 [Blastopirellula sp.]|nr:MAG: hypothetical protein COA78_37205 [Blastopirellula sp.]
MTQTNTNQASAWRGGIVIGTLSVVLLLLLLAFGVSVYLAPGHFLQYKTHYVLWQYGLVERPEPDFDDLIDMITADLPEDWENEDAFETNLTLEFGGGQTVNDKLYPPSDTGELEAVPLDQTEND